jgi:hypothetical protein
MKHEALLKKHVEQYGAQQKVIEAALENLERGSKPIPVLTQEDELWLMTGRIKSVCAIQKEGYKILLETFDVERFRDYVAHQKPVELVLEVFYQKPLKEISMTEILDAIVINCKISNQVDTTGYTDDGDYYTLSMTHDLGINNSKLLQVVHESLFKSYGAKTEFIISSRSLFIKIYKNNILY